MEKIHDILINNRLDPKNGDNYYEGKREFNETEKNYLEIYQATSNPSTLKNTGTHTVPTTFETPETNDNYLPFNLTDVPEQNEKKVDANKNIADKNSSKTNQTKKRFSLVDFFRSNKKRTVNNKIKFCKVLKINFYEKEEEEALRKKIKTTKNYCESILSKLNEKEPKEVVCQIDSMMQMLDQLKNKAQENLNK